MSITQQGQQVKQVNHRLRENAGYTAVYLAILVIGLLIRFYDLSDPPLDFHPTRQLHSLIIARGYYFQYASDITEDQRQTALQQSIAEGRIEPTILEWLTAQAYRMIGKEAPSTARVLSTIFWIFGGIVLYQLCRKDLSPVSGLTVLAFYITIPYAVFASRSFQPDPLVTALLMVSWVLFLNWLDKPVWQKALLAGIAGGVTLLVKTLAVFYLAGILVGMVIAVRKFNLWRMWHTWLMLALYVIPTVIYGVVVWWSPSAGGGITSLRFFPSYWTQIGFYLTWFNMLNEKIGFIWIILSLIGGLCIQSRKLKGAYWGGLAGYLVMGFALSHHISTHDYYSLPLIPLLGLGLSGIIDLVLKGLDGQTRATKIVMAGLLTALFLGNVYQARMTLKRSNYSAQPAFWQKVAEEAAPYSPIVGLTEDYGLRLTYYGGISTNNWFTADEIRLREESGQAITITELFEEKTKNAGGFLVTLFEDFDRQPELQQILKENFVEVSTIRGVELYDLQKRTNK